jgi:serine/threonine protein kinase
MSNLKHPIRVGSILEERYHVQALIGRGATCSVYQATDSQTQRSVAVKLMHSHLVTEEVVVNRFAQEAKTAQLLQHPNIVRVEEYNVSENGVPYLIMELVNGTSLHDVVKGAGWLPTARAFAIFSQVCAALAAAHEKSIVHRDLKPSNIMLTTTDGGDLLVKVLDFGIAKQISMDSDTNLRLTQAGEALGSLLYMSPEQCLDQDIDSRSDCYSMGCVMYETLTGKPPLCARTAFETMNKQISEMPERLDRVRPDLSWPASLQELVFKALAKNPADRYQNISQLQDDLKNVSSVKIIESPAQLQHKQSIATDSSAADDSTEMQIAQANEQLLVDALPSIVRETNRSAIYAQMLHSQHLKTIVFRTLYLIVLAVWLFMFLLPADRESKFWADLIVGGFGVAYSVLFGYIFIYHHRETNLLKKRIAAIKLNRTSKILITKVSPVLPGHFFKMILSAKEPEDEQLETRLSIATFNPLEPIWSSLLTAAELQAVTPTVATFPLTATLYSDSNDDPIAIEIIDSLAWIDDMQDQDINVLESKSKLQEGKLLS